MYYIYRITNLINGKTYIGQHKYKKLDDSYMGSGKILKQAIKKHGIENFKKEILYSRIQYRETADDMERYAIAKERAIGKAEYNIANGGQGGNLGEEVIRRMAASKKGSIPWNKGKKGLQTAWNKGKSSWIKGKHLSGETKKKIGEANKVALKGHTPWNKGKKGLQTAWNKGISMSEETRKKCSEANKGRHHFNNGEIDVFCFECPEGFVPGRLKRNKEGN